MNNDNTELTKKLEDYRLRLQDAITLLNEKLAEVTSLLPNTQSAIPNTASQSETANTKITTSQKLPPQITSRQQTLQQASTAVLAQANQLPSAVLKLLQ